MKQRTVVAVRLEETDLEFLDREITKLVKVEGVAVSRCAYFLRLLNQQKTKPVKKARGK